MVENGSDIIGIDAAANQHGQAGGSLDRGKLFGISRMSGSLPGDDDGIGVEKFGIPGHFRQRAVGNNGMGTVLDMDIGKNPHV